MKRLFQLGLWFTLVLPAFAQHYVALTWTQSALPPDWGASTSYTAGQVVCPQTGNAGHYEYFAQESASSAISGSSEPTWPQTYTPPTVPTTAPDGGIADWAMVVQGTSGVTCPPVTSNNVYRGSQHGGSYTEIYESSIPITSYNDTGCSGACYYVVTAVTANGESGYSNEAAALTPPVASLSPTSLGFGGATVGLPIPAQTITLSNLGGTTLAVASVGITGSYYQSNNCLPSVAPSGSCTISVVFTPAATGSLNGTVTVTDNSGGTSGQTQTASLSGTGAACTATYQTGATGPPVFGGLRNDACPVLVGNVPNLWANFSGDGGYTGAGRCAANALGQTVCRLTDGTTSNTPGQNQLNNYSGGDNDETWGCAHFTAGVCDTDGIVFWGGQSGGVTYGALLNPTTFASGTAFTQLTSGGSPYSVPSKSFAASQQTANAAWVLGTTSNCSSTGPCAIQKYDFSGTNCVSNPASCSPSVTTIHDFSAPGTILNSCFNNTWSGVFRVSADDSLWSFGMSNNQGSGGQGTGTLFLTYSAATGELIWNTGNATVCGILAGNVASAAHPTGQPMTMTGCAGTSAACTGGADQFTIHDAATTHANNLVQVSSDVCLAGTCTGVTPPGVNNDQPYVWNVGTLNAFSTGGGSPGGLSGHDAYGFLALVRGTTPKPQTNFDPIISSGGAFGNGIQNYGVLSSSFLGGFVPNAVTLDVHMSWQPDTANDSWPFLLSSTSYSATLTTANNLPNNGCVIPSGGWPNSPLPNCGATNPFTGPGVNELLIYQTSNTPAGSTPCASWNGSSYTGSSPCTTSGLGRVGPNYISALNPAFNAQNGTIAWSQTGKFYSLTTDFLCTFGNSTGSGAVICGGNAWAASHNYNPGDIIAPTSNNAPNCTFTASGGVSGSTQPATWASGSTCASTVTDNGMTWTLVGKQNARYDVVIGSTGSRSSGPTNLSVIVLN